MDAITVEVAQLRRSFWVELKVIPPRADTLNVNRGRMLMLHQKTMRTLSNTVKRIYTYTM